MVRQKGFLDSFENGSGLARKGVLVRHLIIPGKIENSITALSTLFLEFGGKLPLSIMSQYHPVLPRMKGDLSRFLTREEFNEVYSHALDLGFENLFVQFPEEDRGNREGVSPFVPDFNRKDAFTR
jgi:putative pyruvate formate lyase activating enzyme